MNILENQKLVNYSAWDKFKSAIPAMFSQTKTSIIKETFNCLESFPPINFVTAYVKPQENALLYIKPPEGTSPNENPLAEVDKRIYEIFNIIFNPSNQFVEDSYYLQPRIRLVEVLFNQNDLQKKLVASFTLKHTKILISELDSLDPSLVEEIIQRTKKSN